MATKQLGKLRQWAGEVISSRDKTAVTDEFRELEHDIELRRLGLWRLHVASEGFQHYLSKKKQSEALGDAEKLLPVDTLGVVMIKHGEEFGEDSAFGVSLVNYGRAHCKIATLQETFAVLLEDTYLRSLRQTEDDIKEYQAQRKKLESRRLSYDAALTKLEKIKNSKKDKGKERKEAEEEYALAQSRYEETAEDVHARMYAIQENEVAQLRELTGFLDMEVAFVERHLDVLRDVKANWVDEDTMKKLEGARARPPAPSYPHALDEPRVESVRTKRSPSTRSRHDQDSEDDSSEDGVTRPRSKSLTSKKSEAGSRAPSRPQSRASRKRSDSTATASSEKEREKEKEKLRRISVAGWASSAVSSVTGRGKKDKENFSALQDSDSDEHEHGSRPASALSSSSHKSIRAKREKVDSTPSGSPKLPVANPGQRKIAMALHDFAAGSSDELTFRAGDQIAVVNEVLDGWWMGELKGKRGLFPTTYTEIILSSSSKPPLPHRPPALLRGIAVSAQPALSLDDKDARKTAPADLDRQLTGESDEEHPFGDHNFAASPMYGRFGREDPSSSGDDDEERLVPARDSADDDEWKTKSSWTPPPRPPSGLGGASAPAKKPPPPPPPRRTPNSTTTSLNAPSLPSRPSTLRSKSSHSSSASIVAITTASGMPLDDVDGLTNSPFDSPRDLSDCRDFKQNLFKPKGWCSNCYQLHT